MESVLLPAERLNGGKVVFVNVSNHLCGNQSLVFCAFMDFIKGHFLCRSLLFFIDKTSSNIISLKNQNASLHFTVMLSTATEPNWFHGIVQCTRTAVKYYFISLIFHLHCFWLETNFTKKSNIIVWLDRVNFPLAYSIVNENGHLQGKKMFISSS